jgi:nicotinic acid mononucleotide adenylyltransferase
LKIVDIIAKGRSFALAIAGGGAEVIGELTRHGGSSAILREAIFLSAREATDTYLGFPPDQYCTEWTARQLAMAAYERVKGKEEAFGVGCTCSLAAAGERAGRTHRIYLAVQARELTWAASVELGRGRSREEEETLASSLILKAIEYGQGLATPPLDSVLDNQDRSSARYCLAPPHLQALVHGEVAGPDFPFRQYVLATSANPVHEGHLSMMRWVHEHTGEKVDLEICVRNAAKPPLDYLEIEDRLDAVFALLDSEPAFGTLALSSCGTFEEKARAWPGTTFLIGSDTLNRVMDPKYTGSTTNQFIRMMANDCHLLVFPRPNSRLPAPTEIPASLLNIMILADRFTETDISSTQLRNKRGQT